MSNSILYSRRTHDSTQGIITAVYNPTDDAKTELAAMRAVADTLEALHDDAARARVLRWAADRFGPQDRGCGVASSRPTVLTMDEGLTVEELESLFEQQTAETRANDAKLLEVHDPYVLEEVVKPIGAAQPVSTMIHSFVSDFQKLARDWQSS